MSITGASREAALNSLNSARGDVQQAITAYFDGGAADDGGDVAEAPAAQAAGAPDAIESIMGNLKESQERGPDESRGKGGRDGKGKSSDGPSRTVVVVFFADGFVVDEEGQFDQEEDEPEAAPEAPKPPTRRVGMMTLDDVSSRDGKGKGKGMKLPKKIPTLGPLRSYDTAENKAFLDDMKANRVPQQLQKRDEQGRPIPLSIAVDDERPRTYKELSEVLDQMRQLKAKQEAEEKKNAPAKSTMFTGSGHTLSSSAAPAASAGASSGASGASCDPALLALVRAASAPEADEGKPTTTLQLRLSTGARVKARLNLEHTVADLWRLVAREMGDAAFAAASGHELSAGFPPKPLKDTSVSLAAADLANASVTHRSR